jgi:hypothetical protein
MKALTDKMIADIIARIELLQDNEELTFCSCNDVDSEGYVIAFDYWGSRRLEPIDEETNGGGSWCDVEIYFVVTELYDNTGELVELEKTEYEN